MVNSFFILIAVFGLFFYISNKFIKAGVGVYDEETEHEQTTIMARGLHLILMAGSLFVFSKVMFVLNSKFVDLPTKKGI